MAVQKGANYLEKTTWRKRNSSWWCTRCTSCAKVLILGGGIVGTQAAWMAAGLGADVIIMDVNLPRMKIPRRRHAS